MLKKILSAIMASALCFSMCTFFVSSEEGEMTFFETRECVFAALSEHEDELTFEGGQMSAETFFACVNDIVCDSPFLFYFEGRVDYIADGDGCILSAKPLYSMEKEEAAAAYEVCVRELLKIMLLCPDEASDYEKALFYHDYLCANYEYDLTLESNDLYSFLAGGTGNCMAYTQTYTALLRMSGMTVGYAASDEMEHIWNVVCMDGEWYHVDLTWDDPTGRRLANVGHLQFMFGDETAKKLGYYGWRTAGGVVCANDHKNYEFVASIVGSVVEHGGEYYYVDGGVYRLNFDDIGEELVNGTRGATCMAVCGGQILYGCGEGIYSLDGEKIFSAVAGICGLRESGDSVEYAIVDFADGREAYCVLPLSFGFSGDADKDGEVGVRDLLTVWAYMQKELPSDAIFCKKAADINADGKIDEHDIALMRRKIVNDTE